MLLTMRVNLKRALVLIATGQHLKKSERKQNVLQILHGHSGCLLRKSRRHQRGQTTAMMILRAKERRRKGEKEEI